MIQRTIHGLTYSVISPSFYELRGFPEIDIAYVGDTWLLHVPREDGSPAMQPFKSLDEAAAFVRLGILGAKQLMTLTNPQDRRLTPTHKHQGLWECACESINDEENVVCWNCEEPRENSV